MEEEKKLEIAKLDIVRSNSLTLASYDFSIVENRILDLCCSQMDSKDTVYTANTMFTITATQYAKIYTKNGDPKNCYTQLRKAVVDLFNQGITIKGRDEKTGKATLHLIHWVRKAGYNDGDGSIYLFFDHEILPHLSLLKGNFTQCSLAYKSKLSSTYAMRIYELCMSSINYPFRIISVDDLRFMLGLKDRYPEFKDFRKSVLDLAIKQINTHTDINIELLIQTEKKKAVSLRFNVTEKNKDIEIFPSSKAKSRKPMDSKINLELEKMSSMLNSTTEKKTPKGLKKPSFTLGELH